MKIDGFCYRRTVSLFLAIMIVISCVSCGDSKTDDKSMTRSLLDSYMNSLIDYDIGGINQCCMARLDGYGDGEEVTKGCRILTSRLEWVCEDISIDGNSAIAQVRLTRSDDYENICTAALDDAVDALDRNPDADPAGTLASALKKRASLAKASDESMEISMTKVDNKWYVVKSMGMNRVLSDIRTAVSAVYLMLGY